MKTVCLCRSVPAKNGRPILQHFFCGMCHCAVDLGAEMSAEIHSLASDGTFKVSLCDFAFCPNRVDVSVHVCLCVDIETDADNADDAPK